MDTIKLCRNDFAVTVLLVFFAAFGSYLGNLQLNPTGLMQGNVWFQADIVRVYKNMTERGSNHYRTKVHPIFSLSTAPAVHALSKLGLEKDTAVRLLVACVAGLWLGCFYILLRLLHIHVTDSLLFSCLAAASAAAMFWSTVPETYLFGSLTILLVLAFVALTETRQFPDGYYIAFSALSLSMTVTNWMTGIAATWANNSLRKTIRITVDAFLVVTVLWAIQHAIFPTSEFFLLSPEERHYMMSQDAGGLIEKVTVFFAHSIIMPEVQVLPNRWATSWPFFSVQFSSIGSSGSIGLIAIIGWGLLLAIGTWSGWHNPANKKVKVVIAIVLVGQLILHLVYGDETFLYSIHWAPLLILVAAFGLTSKFRPLVLTLATVVAISASFNNFQQFQRVSSELWQEKYGGPISQRDELLSAMDAHPQADWPRGVGHVLLANAGSRLEHKGYHEPGGSFSPGFGSFGISLLFFDHRGNFKFSTNSISPNEITQSVSLAENSVNTTTRWYSAKWTALANSEWVLDVSLTTELIPVLKVSSSGPAGGPIHGLSWDGKSLIVNKSHEVSFEVTPEKLLFDDERSQPVFPIETASVHEVLNWNSEEGFARVLFSFPENTSLRFKVKILEQGGQDDSSPIAASTFRFDLPDERFVNSLEGTLAGRP